MTQILTQKTNLPDVNYLDLPDMNVNFGTYPGVSCGLKDADALLEFFAPFFADWIDNQYSLHEFATKYKHEGISLWTANDVAVADDGLTAVQIFLESDVKGYIMLHCYLTPREQLH